MNYLKSTLCLLIVLPFGYVSHSQELTNTSCPITSDCKCIETEDQIKENTGEIYTFSCPKSGKTTLEGGKTVEKVYIECRNYVTDFTLLKEFNFNGVRTVEFHRCRLPKGSFKSLIQSTGINATEKFDFRYSPNIEDSLTKDHLAGFGNVKQLSLPMNEITRLPDDFLQGLTNLKSLNLARNKITSPPDDFLKGLVNLTSINLEGNNITLSKQFFSHVTQLEELKLQVTDHKETDERSIFENLTKLKYLRLVLVNSNLPKNVFTGLSNLEKLIIHVSSALINENELRLPDGLVSDNSKLQEFYLLRTSRYVNDLRMPNYFLSNLTNLKRVVLRGQELRSIPGNTFWYSSSIKQISIFKNNLQKLPQDLFRDQINLERLFLYYNKLEHIPDKVFKNLANLEELHLGFNCLKNISSPGIFDGLSNLKSLDLSRNQLNHIDVRAFRPLIKLESIKLNDNRLFSLIAEGFHSFFQSGIEIIQLHGNKFEKVGGNLEKFINESTKLKELTLSGNPLVCDCSARELINIIQSKWKQVKFSISDQEPTCASNNRPLRNIAMSEICSPQVAHQSE